MRWKIGFLVLCVGIVLILPVSNAQADALMQTPNMVTKDKRDLRGVLPGGTHWFFSNGTLYLNGGQLPESPYERGHLDSFSNPICAAINQTLSAGRKLSENAISTVIIGQPIPGDTGEIKNPGKVYAPENATVLFCFTSVDSIQGLTNLDTSQTKLMDSMFRNSKVQNIDLSNMDTRNVTSMSEMFENMPNIEDIDISQFDVRKVQTTFYMFNGCENLQQVRSLSLEFNNDIDMTGMFGQDYCLKSLDLSKWDVSSVKKMDEMFQNDTDLASIALFKPGTTRNVTDMSAMFQSVGLTTIDFSNFDTQSVISMESMFMQDSKLQDLDLSSFDTSKVTNMGGMFGYDYGLIKLNVMNFDTSHVTDFSYMFENDSQLAKLNLSRWNTSNGNDFRYMFFLDNKLQTLNIANFKSDNAQKLSTFIFDLPVLQTLDISGMNLNPNLSKVSLEDSYDVISKVPQLSSLRIGPNFRFNIKNSNIHSPADDSNVPDGKWIVKGHPEESYTETELIKMYDKGIPTKTETYIWQPSNPKPVTPVVPPVKPITPTPQPTVPPIIQPTLPVQPEPSQPELPVTTPTTPKPVGNSANTVQRHASINGVRKLALYRTPNFSAKTRRTWYAAQPRTRQPQFVVLGRAKSTHGTLRYRVRDVNHHSKTAGLQGYVTARPAFVQPTYYQQLANPQSLTVINPRGANLYRTTHLTGKLRHYRQGQVLRVKHLVHYHLTTRFQLNNGDYVTANRQFTQLGRHVHPRQVSVRHPINRYRDVNLRHRHGSYRVGHRLTVSGWDFSDHGTVRFRIGQYYITANSRWLKF